VFLTGAAAVSAVIVSAASASAVAAMRDGVVRSVAASQSGCGRPM
jgi:hypothetical protein